MHPFSEFYELCLFLFIFCLLILKLIFILLDVLEYFFILVNTSFQSG